MLIYKYDGTIDGIFSCVFTAFVNKEKPDLVTAENNVQIALDGMIREINTDYLNNKRIITALYRYIGINALSDIRYAFRCGDDVKANVIFKYICKTFEYRKNISTKFSEQTVLDFYDTVRKIANEVHRMKGFLRFSESAQGFYYAHFEPDHDIADLLLPHFAMRFKSIPFIIHDVKRNILAMYDGKEYKTVNANQTIYVQLSENEESMQNLWQTYYSSITIKERKNHKLMNAFLPIRYRTHMVEKTYS
jgi:probable DNA metabolism protein